jgi:hypothetical protein
MIQIPKWLIKIWKAIQQLFNGIPAHLKKAIHTGVTVTENIKNFVDSPVADIITALIPGETDNQVKEALRKALPVILVQLRLADQCSTASSPDQITACAIKTLQSLTGNLKSASLHSLSVLIAQVAADGKLTWEEGAYIMEWYYQHRYKS